MPEIVVTDQAVGQLYMIEIDPQVVNIDIELVSELLEFIITVIFFHRIRKDFNCFRTHGKYSSICVPEGRGGQTDTIDGLIYISANR